SFIRRGLVPDSPFEKTQHSQAVIRAAVPSKQSSPPAEKCGVCIGATPPSQAEMAEKPGIRALLAPNTSCRSQLLPRTAGFPDDIKIFRALTLHKRLELCDRHRRHDRPGCLQACFHVGLGQNRVDLLVKPVNDGLGGAARREKAGPKREII